MKPSKFKRRIPNPNETDEEAEELDRNHEYDYWMEEAFKIGLRLGIEVSKYN